MKPYSDPDIRRVIVAWTGISALLLGACKKNEPSAGQSPSTTPRAVSEKTTTAPTGQPETTRDDAAESTQMNLPADPQEGAATGAVIGAIVGGAVMENEPNLELDGDQGVVTVTDPSAVNVPDGQPGPKAGEKIYTEKNLPKDACGTYWVKDDRGVVEEMSICKGEACGH